MAGERITPAAGVVAEGTFEGLLPRVQLDVTQQVPLLCEGGTALIAVEGPLPYRWKKESQMAQGGTEGGGDALTALWMGCECHTYQAYFKEVTWGPLTLARCGLEMCDLKPVLCQKEDLPKHYFLK